MKIRRFFGKDMREALRQVKDELGGNAVIMSNKKTAQGVELVAAIDPAEEPKFTNQQKVVAPKSSLREIIGDEESDSLQALLQRTNSNKATVSSMDDMFDSSPNSVSSVGKSEPSSARADDNIVRSPAFVDQAASISAAGKNDLPPPPSVLEPDQLDTIRAELESIKNVLKHQVSELSEERKKRNNPVHHYLRRQLDGMGICSTLGEQLINFLPHQIDEKEGWRYLLNLLSNRIFTSGNDILRNAGVVALVGPTGTGKTTTLAKLAARYSQKYGADQVAMITIDTFRIAAFEQLATYGRIIGCVAKKAQSAEELSQLLYQLRHKSLILIDTAGFSQRDSRLIEQLHQFEALSNTRINMYLTMPAGSQYKVLKETVRTYMNADLKGCILTKLDECYSLGEALSVIIENDLALSYVTDGQRVPEDIKLADAGNLTLIAAKLFRKYALSEDVSQPLSSVGAI